MQEWFTARELAEIAAERGLKSFPTTERGVRIRVGEAAWNDLPERFCRWRRAKGGRPAREYHRSLLPNELQAALASREERARLAAVQVAETEAERRQIEAIRISALSPRARAVMEARAEILTSIEGYAIAQGERRAWGIARFLDAQAAWERRLAIEERRDASLPLTDAEAAALRQPLVLTSSAGFGVSAEKLARANDRAGRGRSLISRATIYDWFRARDARGVHALAPAPTKAAQPIPAGFGGFLRHYAIGSSPSASDALGEYLKTNPAPEMRLTIAQVRYVLRERLNNIEKHVGREGLLTLRSRLAYVTRTTEDMWPTTIYTADGKTFDAEVLDPVTNRPIRPEITTVLDVVTRKAVGIAISRKENVIAVTEALRNSCAWGIPAIFYVDRGPGYKNKVFDADVNGLMGRLGITKMHAAPYGSQAKGRIERPNATIWDVLAKRLPSYIGEDMDKEAGQKVHRLSRRALAETGTTRLIPSWEDFLRLCAERVAEYNAAPHRGLPRLLDEQGRRRHMSPDEAWAAHVTAGFEAVPLDPAEADDLFRPYEIRVASRAMVSIFGNSYFDLALEAYHDRKVMVGYDYAQADRVWVREFDEGAGQPGRLICVARFGGNAARYVPLTYEQRALEQRAKSQKQRLQRKIDDVDAQLGAPFLLEQAPEIPAPFLDARPEPEPLPDVVVPAPRKRVFASDEELAIWALEHPADLLPNQIRVLRDCVNSPAHRELFRMSGIDVEALRTLLRGAA